MHWSLYATLTPAPPPVSKVIVIGEQKILTAKDGGNANLLVAQSAELNQAATIQSISFYVTNAGGNLTLGIYDAKGPNGGPGSIVAQTSSFTPMRGWNTASVLMPVALQPGTYWLTYLPSSDTLQFVKQLTGNSNWSSFSYGVMPSTFTATTGSEAVHWSMYATLLGF